MFPHVGAANTPYARSVFPGTIQPGALPDPGLIFDSLYARDEFKPSPNNVSSVLFYWASLIIHGQQKSPRTSSVDVTLLIGLHRSFPDRP